MGIVFRYDIKKENKNEKKCVQENEYAESKNSNTMQCPALAMH